MAIQPPPRRTLGDAAYTVGPLNFNSIAVPANNTTSMVMSLALIQLVQNNQFHGLSNENPYKHLTIFGEICNTVKIIGVSDDSVKLSLFPFSLGGNVKDWLHSFPEGTFRTWEAVANQFISKYFPLARISQGRLEISSFKQGREETFGRAWNRFKDLLRKTPVHGFDKTSYLLAFLRGLCSHSKMVLDSSAGGSINRKTEDEAYNLIELMADNEEAHDTHGDAIQELSMIQNNVITQQLEEVTKRLAELSRTCIGTSQAPQMLHFNPIQRSAESEETFQRIMKKSACINDCVMKGRGEEACEIVTISGRIVKEREIEDKGSIEEEKNQKEEEEEKNLWSEKKKEEAEKFKEKEYEKPLPYPQIYSRKDKQRQFDRFMEIFKKLEITIPFSEAIQQIPSYSKFLKEIITKKRKYAEKETIEVEGNCSAIIQRSLTPKSPDPGSFTIPCAIGELEIGKALIDLGANINLMPLTMFKKLKGVELKQTRMVLQLADRSLKYPFGIAEENGDAPLIMGRPFMKTSRIVIDVEKGKLKVQVQDEEVNFDVFQVMSHPKDDNSCFQMDLGEEICMRQENRIRNVSILERALTNECEDLNEEEDLSHKKCIQEVEVAKEVSPEKALFEQLDCIEKVSDSKIELKELPSHLKYVFLEDHGKSPVIISASLSQEEEIKLVGILKENKGAIGWSITDLKGISPTYCMHKILMEDDYKPIAQPQRRLNLVMKEVVRKEVLKLLEAGIIYPISDSKWVSPVQVVPKKGGMTVIHNEKNELIPTRTVTGWWMCIDCRRLNTVTRKDHFPLPFMDHMLEILAGQAYYCFLDGYSGYNQIMVDPEDQEK